MRSRPGGVATSSRNGRDGGAVTYGDPGSGAEIASSIAALSRTERVITCSIAAPSQSSPSIGPVGVRPRVGLSPNRPQQDAGMRIDPPPSPAPARGTIPAATAAADPPLDPPLVLVRSHGLWVGPKISGSVNGVSPNSGVFVLPRITTPDCLYRRTISESIGAMKPSSSRLPLLMGAPAYHD